MIDKPWDDVSAEIEAMAKAMLRSGGADPDQLVQPGRPQVYGTPQGEAFAVVPDAALPLWRLYIVGARTALELARGILAPVQEAADDVAMNVELEQLAQAEIDAQSQAAE